MRRGQDHACRRQRHFPAQSRRLSSCKSVGRAFAGDRRPDQAGEVGVMTYSYTQISNYLTCPRKYRHRYLDGWQEKDPRAAMLFGRAFEQALAAYFRHDDPAATLFREWAVYQKQPLYYSERSSWDSMLQ